MQETPYRRNPLLDGDEALKKWREGPESWNNWIRENPAHDIHFDAVDFSSEREAEEAISFAGYDFGSGNVSFIGAKFGDGDVSFRETRFGEGNLHFMEATFGRGNIDFSHTSFGEGQIYFVDTNFGEGDLSFSESEFGNGDVFFCRANFGVGNLDFSNSTFGLGDVDFREATFGCFFVKFSDANFGEGCVYFTHTTFSNGVVSFSHCKFGKDKVFFSGANFRESLVSFQGAEFGESSAYFSGTKIKDLNFSSTNASSGEIRFDGAYFGEGNVSFNEAKLSKLFFTPSQLGTVSLSAQGLVISTAAVFELPSSIDQLEDFHFLGASFKGPLILSGSFQIVPDFLATNSSHQVELSGLKVKLRRIPASPTWHQRMFIKAKDPQDAARLRRLKEIAESNKDHQAALRFSADEHRARRWDQTSKLGSVLDIAFSALSNYGQSILRPSCSLFFFYCVFTSLLLANSTAKSFESWTGWLQSALLSASNTLPFLPQSRSLREDAVEALYFDDPSLLVDSIMIGQGALSFIFLFLIGLGVRNRFRL